MTEKPWIESGRPFLEAIDKWYRSLPSLPLKDVIVSPARLAVACIDLTVGFAYEGALASPRVARIVPAVVRLFRKAHDRGVRYFLLPQDQHSPDSIEFEAYGSHSVAGTEEAATVPELLELPFADLFQVLPKDSINPFLDTELGDWVNVHPGVNTYLIAGDCTDLCVYQLAMHLRVEANAKGLKRRVIVPADCVDTYHVSVETAAELGILPHEGDLLHRIFLYHMALNKIEVVRELV